MRFKVELHVSVARFLKTCDDETVSAFWERVDEVRNDPVGRSEAVSEPNVSRYMLRYFRFARYLALFQVDPIKGRIVVRSCRKQQPGRQRDPNGP